MNIKPLSDNIVIRPLETKDRTPGGILIPDMAKEKPTTGEVVAVGPGARHEGKRLEPDVEVGDIVVYSKYAGNLVTLGGVEVLLLREQEIFAVLREGLAGRPTGEYEIPC